MYIVLNVFFQSFAGWIYFIKIIYGKKTITIKTYNHE